MRIIASHRFADETNQSLLFGEASALLYQDVLFTVRRMARTQVLPP